MVGSLSRKYQSWGLHDETFKKNTPFARDLDENADITNCLHISVDANAKAELVLFFLLLHQTEVLGTEAKQESKGTTSLTKHLSIMICFFAFFLGTVQRWRWTQFLSKTKHGTDSPHAQKDQYDDKKHFWFFVLFCLVF